MYKQTQNHFLQKLNIQLLDASYNCLSLYDLMIKWPNNTETFQPDDNVVKKTASIVSSVSASLLQLNVPRKVWKILSLIM